MSWWISCRKFTVLVETDERRIIIDAAPMVRKFLGQPLDNLAKWARGFGGLQIEAL